MLQHVATTRRSSDPVRQRLAGFVGIIQRGLPGLENQGAAQSYGDRCSTSGSDAPAERQRGREHPGGGKADELAQAYSTFLLWMLAELFEHCPRWAIRAAQTGFSFSTKPICSSTSAEGAAREDRAVVRLIRSKGVGVYS